MLGVTVTVPAVGGPGEHEGSGEHAEGRQQDRAKAQRSLHVGRTDQHATGLEAPSGWHCVVTSGAIRARISRTLTADVCPGLETITVIVVSTFSGRRASAFREMRPPRLTKRLSDFLPQPFRAADGDGGARGHAARRRSSRAWSRGSATRSGSRARRRSAAEREPRRPARRAAAEPASGALSAGAAKAPRSPSVDSPATGASIRKQPDGLGVVAGGVLGAEGELVAPLGQAADGVRAVAGAGHDHARLALRDHAAGGGGDAGRRVARRATVQVWVEPGANASRSGPDHADDRVRCCRR